MRRWTTTIVAPPLTVAANQSLGVFPRRRHLSITRTGAYTRIVLTRRDDMLRLPAAPRWA